MALRKKRKAKQARLCCQESKKTVRCETINSATPCSGCNKVCPLHLLISSGHHPSKILLSSTEEINTFVVAATLQGVTGAHPPSPPQRPAGAASLWELPWPLRPASIAAEYPNYNPINTDHSKPGWLDHKVVLKTSKAPWRVTDEVLVPRSSTANF